MKQRGFTILEVLIAITILGIVSLIAILSFSGFRSGIAINTETEDILSILEEARILTTSSYLDSQYGVHFESNRLVLFKGTLFTEPNADNVVKNMQSNVTISSINLNGGGDDVLFERITGNTNEYGTVVLQNISNASTTRTINIYNNGIIDIE